MLAKTPRSELTQNAIVDMALEMAALEGLESLSIGELAKRLNLSKSGVFSRVGSREALQCAVLAEFDRRFVQAVLLPALREPRGLPRLNAIMQAWLARIAQPGAAGACLYVAGAFEFDDREGALREVLMAGIGRWRQALKRSVLQAVEQGHLRADLEADQLVFELDAVYTGVLRETRFQRDPRAAERGLAAYARLLRDYRPA